MHTSASTGGTPSIQRCEMQKPYGRTHEKTQSYSWVGIYNLPKTPAPQWWDGDCQENKY